MGLNAGRKSDRELPPMPDKTVMTKSEYGAAMKACQKLIEKEYDRDRKLKRNAAPMFDDIIYTSDNSLRLRPMSYVHEHPLEEGHTFKSDKKAFKLRIVEEANFLGVRINFARSDSYQVLVKGTNEDSFSAAASYNTKMQAWRVVTCITRSGQIFTCPPRRSRMIENASQNLPSHQFLFMICHLQR